MHYPVLVKPRRPSLSRMTRKNPKRAGAAKAKKGRKTSASRSKAAPRQLAKRSAKPARRGAPAADDARATIRGLRSKLKEAERRVAGIGAAGRTELPVSYSHMTLATKRKRVIMEVDGAMK